ncbi:MAG: DUF3352 domain-containing protein [Dermatophilaceae bacterium]
MSNAYPHEAHQPTAPDPTTDPDGPPSKRRRTGLIAAVVVAGVVTVGGVGTAVGMKMLGGSGAQPDEVLPKSSILYTRIDLDPSAGQKISAYRLLDKLPTAKNIATAQDPKKALFEELKKNDSQGTWSDVDYERDIGPWLGDRVGVSLLAPDASGADPTPVLAIQVKDQAAAEEGYTRLRDKAKNATASLPGLKGSSLANLTASGGSLGTGVSTAQPGEDAHWFKDDYLIVTDKKSEQSVRSAMDAGALRDSADYVADMAALGDQGIASMWTDGPRLIDVLPQQPETQNLMRALKDYQGRSASTLRFSSDYVELASVGRGAAKRLGSGEAVRDVAGLPDNPVAVLSFSGGGDMVTQLWPMLQDTATAANGGRDPLAGVEQASGLKLPADLATMLGKQVDVVVPQQTFSSRDMPAVGARLTTDQAGAQAILDKVAALGADVPRSACGDRLCLGSTNGAAARLADAGAFGENSAYKASVADADKAGSIMYVDLDQIESYYVDLVPNDYRDLVRSLRAVGMSSFRDGDTDRSTLRLLAG